MASKSGFMPAPTKEGLSEKLPTMGSTHNPAHAKPAPAPRNLPAPREARRKARPKRHPDLAPTHPGAMLREIVVPATGRSKTELARLLGVSRQTFHDVLAEKAAVTPQLALRLGKMFGDGPEPWLRMQGAYDVWTLSRTLAVELEAIPTLEAAE